MTEWDHGKENKRIEIYTDGSCTGNGTDEAIAGAGIYVPNNNALKFEDRGFLGVKNVKEIKVTIARLHERKAPTNLRWVKGHSGIEGNEKADQLAKEGSEKSHTDTINMTIPPPLQISGMKLNKLMQATAYKAIQHRKMNTRAYQNALNRKATKVNIGRAKASVQEIGSNHPTDTNLWKSIRNKDFERKTRTFLWMVYHNAYKNGEYWDTIPGYEIRANCSECRCNCPGQDLIWRLGQELWKNKRSAWVKPHFGIILGCGLANFKNDDNKPLSGDSRLYRILISESTYLIWKLRCERNEIIRRWRKTLENRIQLD
ncbi:hypothetical protein C8R41DRAFT_898810 [Lentinula lateritia]|uniref:ribonuclease H n=1 Tax=Lentinula lateritia TaxID=40482 RepID=A0ABQ8UXT5_9AGAR|nr:hypothetical protein C8R41DRAFT_898810 [Lentinula lateritia]